ncbi:hypothetical protein ABES58_08545 [Paenibacillus lautus]|uniref:hypothetical protein n=1 Tax=Paenibacillus TaxID=44249 RepID=UPI0030D826E3
MQPIPISAEGCRGYVGKTVCAVMRDGTEVVGTIRGVHDRGLELEFANPSVYTLSTKGKKGKKSSKSAKSGAQTSAFGPYGYGGGYGAYGGYGWGGNVFAWEAIALLFLIPFLFI